MDALVVIDMQVGLLDGAPKLDLEGVVGRINRLATMVRQRGWVVWVQHCGPEGTDFAPGQPGWNLLPELQRGDGDIVVAVSDAQTLADRPHLDAVGVIRHHTWVWANLITPGSIRIATTAELLAETA